MLNEKIALYSPPYTEITSYIEMVDFAKKYGFKNLETLSILEFSKPDIEFAKRLREYADKNDIKIICTSKGGTLVSDNISKSIENFKRYADIAKILGSQYLHHTIVLEFSNPDNVLPYKDIYLKKGVEAAREINEYGKSIGIETIIEEQGYIFNGLKNYKYLANELKDIGVLADTGNIMMMEEKLEDFIPHFSDRIKHVHIKDMSITPREAREKNKEDLYTINKNYITGNKLGEGQVNFEKIYNELKKTGYNGYYSIEVHGEILKENVKDYFDSVNYFNDFLNTHK